MLGPLVELGADLDGDPYRGTALIWAGARGHVASIRRLIELGADPDRQATFGGPEHGQGVTALHIAAQSGKMKAVQALLAAGADPTIRTTSTAARPRAGPSTEGTARDRRLPARATGG